MKIKLLLLVAFFSAYPMFAQYEFAHATETYATLPEEAVTVNRTAWSDNGYFDIPLPFPIFVFEDEVDIFRFDTGQFVGIGKSRENAYILVPQNAAVIDQGFSIDSLVTNSPIKYITVGESGQRIFKVEVNNAASSNEIDSLGTDNMRLNYQVWFFENNQNIEFRYGNNTVTDFDLCFLITPQNGQQPFSGFTPILVRYRLQDPPILDALVSLTGMEANPEILNNASGDLLSTYPATGRVYRFGRNLSIPKMDEVKWRIYPNPVENSLQLSGNSHTDDLKFEIYDSAGRRVNTGIFKANESIDVSTLQSGIYFLKLEGQGATKFIKR